MLNTDLRWIGLGRRNSLAAGDLLSSRSYINPDKDETMKIKTATIVIAVLVLIFLALVVTNGFTVVKIADAEAAVQSEKFDPVSYVDGIWDTKLIPAFNEKAVDLSTILGAMKVNPDGTISKDDLTAVTSKNGLITVGESHVYEVKGTGKIVGVNTDTSLGTVEVALDGYQGPVKVLIYIGTRIPSDETSVRDAVGFISFGDFKEQTEYGKVASEINKRVLSKVLSGLDKDSLLGKTVTFKGALGIRTFNLLQIDLKELKIVPVEIKLGD
jgi:predicted lipoprotein